MNNKLTKDLSMYILKNRHNYIYDPIDLLYAFDWMKPPIKHTYLMKLGY